MDPLVWCRERLLVSGSPLAASLPFAPEDSRSAILSLRAVISEIAAVPDTVSDADIGRKKLAWWHTALRERSPHPAIEALVASGAADRLDPSRFDALIASVGETFESPRFENRDAAWAHCLAIGGPAASLEAALFDRDEPGQGGGWDALGAFAYLVRVVRDLGVDARANRWLVPLDLQAEYQVARKDALAGTAGRGWDGMIRAWLDDGLVRSGRALETKSTANRWRQRHLCIEHALDARLARVLARRPATILTRPPRPGHIGQVWCAWRAARRLGRACRQSSSANE